MEIFKFIAWWWNKQSYGDKWGIAFFANLGTVIPLCLIFGFKGLFIMLGLLVLFGIIGLCTLIYQQVKMTWQNYKEEMEKERDEIARRLRGEYTRNW